MRNDLNPFLKKINSILIEKNLSPTYLSVMAGLGSSTLSNLLRRNNIPSYATLEKLCAVLDLKTSSFIKEIEDQNPEMIAKIRSGVKKHDPNSYLKKQIIDEWSGLPVNDRNETFNRMRELVENDGDDKDGANADENASKKANGKAGRKNP